MAANPNPIFTKAGNVSTDNAGAMSQGLASAAADYDGTGANNVLVFTAGAEGAFVQRLRFSSKGSNAAAVARVYINNGSSPGTAANNALYAQVSLPSTTASATVGTADVDHAMNFALPAGYRLYVGLGAAVSAGWVCTAIGGNY